MKRRLTYTVLFAAFVLTWLLSALEPYLKEVGETSVFFADTAFARQTVGQAGGLLAYAASALEGCFATPWCGALILAALLTAVAWAAERALRLGGGWFALCLVPPLMLLLAATQCGYLLYMLKSPAPVVLPTAGVLSALLFAWGWGSVAVRMPQWWRVCAAAVLGALGYIALGVYIALAWLLVAVTAARSGGQPAAPAPRPWRSAAAGLAAAALCPFVLWHLGLLHQRYDSCFTVGLPDYLWASERALFLPLALCAAALVALALIARAARPGRWLRCGALAVAVGTSVAVTAFAFTDVNFLSILRMRQALVRGDYEAVLRAIPEGTEPTRVQVMMTRCALMRLGRMGDTLFTYTDGDAPYASPRQFYYQQLLASHILYYEYGKVAFSYRWCMEDMVEYGERPVYLRQMARCALLSGEPELALRYADRLEAACHYGADVAAIRSAVRVGRDGTLRCKATAEAARMRPLLQYNDVLDGDGGMIENYILQSFAHTDGGSREIVELALMHSLIVKDLSQFWPRFFALYPTWSGHIPTHYAEAALMVARLEGGRDISALPIAPELRSRFDRLVEASAQYGDQSDAAAEALRSEFGGTYWYYYFFIRNLKSS